jgi:hypothetical protein
MEASVRLMGLVDELIALFNQRSEDLPDHLFDRRTQFVLNGVPFEETLGRPSSDPLVLMLTRGPAGYRLVLKAVLHAVPDARIERGEFATDVVNGAHLLRWQCWLSGHLRGTAEPTETVFDAEFVITPAGVVERAAVAIDEGHLGRIRDARMRA